MLFFFSITVFAQIEVEQWLDKTEYVEGEPVFLFVRATNHTDVPVMFGIYYNTEINIYDSNGNRYEPILNGNYIYGENLFPDSTHESFIELTDMYGEIPPNVFYPYFKEGTYYIYLHWKDKGMEIITPKLYFRVKKPDKNQQPVFDEILNIVRIYYNKETSKAKSLMLKLLEKYPNNIYTPVIYSFIWLFYKSDKVAFNLADQFIYQFPHHPYARMALSNIVAYFRRKKDKEGAIRYFKKLLKENLDPGLNRTIQKNVLKRILNTPIQKW